MGIIWRILIEYTEIIIITILFMAIIVLLSYLRQKYEEKRKLLKRNA